MYENFRVGSSCCELWWKCVERRLVCLHNQSVNDSLHSFDWISSAVDKQNSQLLTRPCLFIYNLDIHTHTHKLSLYWCHQVNLLFYSTKYTLQRRTVFAEHKDTQAFCTQSKKVRDIRDNKQLICFLCWSFYCLLLLNKDQEYSLQWKGLIPFKSATSNRNEPKLWYSNVKIANLFLAFSRQVFSFFHSSSQ